MSNAFAGDTLSQQNEATVVKESFFGPPLSQSQLARPQGIPSVKPPRAQDLSLLIRKLSFEERANPTIHEGHPDFVRLSQYFSTLLKSTQLTLEDILDRTFSPHEIRLLEPAAAPSPIASLQKDNIIRYKRILETRFKGQTPSLELKLTLLFFGLPVAPMKPGIPEVDVSRDLDFGEHKLTMTRDPLEFLDDYSVRSYGDPSQRVNDPYFPQLGDTQEFPSMSLRGGALPANMAWETDDIPMAPLPSQPQGRPMRVYGFQGSVLADPNKPLHSSFVEAVDQLLGMTDGLNYAIRLEIWNLSDVQEAHIVEQATGMVRHTAEEPTRSDEIYALLSRWFVENDSAGEYSCFVCFDKEDSPNSCQPFYELERYLVRVWDAVNQKMAYMKVPESLQSTHKPNQFNKAYLRTMRILFPKIPHAYLQFAEGGPVTYGLFDPPPETWTQIINDQARGGELPLLSFSLFPIANDQVAVWVPGSHAYDNDFSPLSGTKNRKSGTVHKDVLRLTGTNEDRVGLESIFAQVAASNVWMEKFQSFAGLDLWIPGEDYLDTRVRPSRVSFDRNGITAQAVLDWRDILSGYQRSRIHSTSTSTTSSIVARPVFTAYRFRAKDSRDRLFSMPAIDIEGSFAEFKEAVKSRLYPDYSDTQKDLVLHLTQSTWGWNKVDFVIGSDTDEKKWNWIVRRITEPDITVSLEIWTSGWSVENNTTWGPRYRVTRPKREISSRVEASRRERPFGRTMDRIFKDSVNNEKSAARAKELRERFFWDAPSIFTNPAKPVIPTQGAPLESVVRTGPYVPGYTTAMRTPGEMARLERETHTLRGNLLDRIRECPYADCHRYFPFRDREGLARHLTEDHATLRCFLCDKESTLLPYYDQNSIRRHFIDVHQRDILDAMGGSTSTTGKSGAPVPGPSQPPLPTPGVTVSGPPQPPQPTSGVTFEAPVLPPPGSQPKDTNPIESESKQPARSTSLGRQDEMNLDEEEVPVSDTDFGAYPPIPRWREATVGDPIPRRRAPSPAWDLLLEPQASGPNSFQPDPEWRCSRCFRSAGFNIEVAEMHMSEEGSCKIRRGLGTMDISLMPNRSGWILPTDQFDFGKAFFDFIEKYPGYRHTMFPVRDETVQETYESPQVLASTVGSNRDDPNHPSNTVWTRVLELPWPPYEGTVIPVGKPQGDDGPNNLFDDPFYVPGPPPPVNPPVVNINFNDQITGPILDIEQLSKGTDPLPPDPFFTAPKASDPVESSDWSVNDPQGSAPAGTGGASTSFDNPYLAPRRDTKTTGGKTPGRGRKTPAAGADVPVKVEELSSSADELSDVPQVPVPVPRTRRTKDVSFIETGDEDETNTGTEYVPTTVDDEDEDEDDEPEPETSPRKRRRYEDRDPTFRQVAADDDLVTEEFSEASAVPDPVGNLDPNAPRTPTRPRRGRGRPRNPNKTPTRPRGSGAKTGVQQAPAATTTTTATTTAAAPAAAEAESSEPEDIIYRPEYRRDYVSLPPDWDAARRVVMASGRGNQPPRRFGFRRSSSGEPEVTESSPRRSSRTRRGTGPI